jgi:hypothetical protein
MNIYILLDFQPAFDYAPHPTSKLIFLCVLEVRQVKYEWSYEYLECSDHRLHFTGLLTFPEQVDANGTRLWQTRDTVAPFCVFLTKEGHVFYPYLSVWH